MTSDIVQNTYISKRKHAASMELTRNESFIAGATDIFDLLDGNGNTATPVKKYDPGTIDLLKTAYKTIEQAEQTIANQNKRIKALEGLLTTDELTGLKNRRGFYDAFKSETDRTNRGENKGGLLIMIDLDNFKTINDTYGHQAGDAALRLVGSFLDNEVRSMDVAARLGGDEFIVLFPNTNKNIAMKRAQTLGVRLNNLSLVWTDAEIPVRASIGLKDYRQGDTIDSIIKEADCAMYKSKANGKRSKYNSQTSLF